MASRSTQSLRFEEIIRRASTSVAVARLSMLDDAMFGELASWISIVEPDQAAFTLRFARAGEAVLKMLGGPLIGVDYLEFVDPAIKGDAFDSAFVMLSRPCGLWQITPTLTQDGRTITAEYTGFPIFDQERQCGLLITLAHIALQPPPVVAQVRHATEWHWIELKSGGALH